MSKRPTFKKNKPSAKTILIFIVTAFLFFVLLTSVIEITKKYLNSKTKLNELKDQKELLSQKMNEITAENEFLSTPEGQEKIIREKYRLVKPGEGLILITEKDSENDINMEKRGGKVKEFWDSILRGVGLRD